MLIKQRTLTAITKHPKVVIFGIGLAVTAGISLAVLPASASEKPVAMGLSLVGPYAM